MGSISTSSIDHAVASSYRCILCWIHSASISLLIFPSRTYFQNPCNNLNCPFYWPEPDRTKSINSPCRSSSSCCSESAYEIHMSSFFFYVYSSSWASSQSESPHQFLYCFDDKGTDVHPLRPTPFFFSFPVLQQPIQSHWEMHFMTFCFHNNFKLKPGESGACVRGALVSPHKDALRCRTNTPCSWPAWWTAALPMS